MSMDIHALTSCLSYMGKAGRECLFEIAEKDRECRLKIAQMHIDCKLRIAQVESDNKHSDRILKMMMTNYSGFPSRFLHTTADSLKVNVLETVVDAVALHDDNIKKD